MWLGHHFQGQKVKGQARPLCSPPCWRVRQPQRWAWERVGREKLRLRCRLLCRARRASAPTGEERGGAYRGGRPPTACCIISQRHWIKSSAILFGSVDISRWRPNLSRGFISLRLTGENVLLDKNLTVSLVNGKSVCNEILHWALNVITAKSSVYSEWL